MNETSVTNEVETDREKTTKSRWETMKKKILSKEFLLMIFFFFGYTVTDYPYFTSQLTPPFVIFFMFISLLIIFLFNRNFLTKEMRQFPKYHFFIMAIFDTLSNILQSVGSIGMGPTAGPLVVVLAQGLIPITVILSIILLKARYSPLQVIGTILILGGLGVNLTPSFSDLHTSSSLWAIAFFCSNFPGSLAAIYKEWAFGKTKLNIIYLGLWENFFISIIGNVIAPIYFVAQKMPVKDLWIEYEQGAKCIGGINSLMGDNCHDGWETVILFNFWAFTWVLTGLGIVFYGSANLAFFSQALVLPLCDFLFSSKLIMGGDSSKITMYDYLGMVIISVGIIIYTVPLNVKWPCARKLITPEESPLLTDSNKNLL